MLWRCWLGSPGKRAVKRVCVCVWVCVFVCVCVRVVCIKIFNAFEIMLGLTTTREFYPIFTQTNSESIDKTTVTRTAQLQSLTNTINTTTTVVRWSLQWMRKTLVIRGQTDNGGQRSTIEHQCLSQHTTDTGHNQHDNMSQPAIKLSYLKTTFVNRLKTCVKTYLNTS